MTRNFFTKRRVSLSLSGVLILTLLIGLAALLPGLTMISRPWPGFFYSPFYTVNSFTEPEQAGWQAGIRPEQRLIYVGPKREPLYNLPAAIAQTPPNSKIELFFEVGPFLPSVELPVTPLGAGRWLEKAGPLIAAGLLMLALAFRQRSGSGRRGWLVGFEVLAGWALITAPDYFLSSGLGLESGFEVAGRLQSGNWMAASSKWSTYIYWLLWLGAVGCGLACGLAWLKAQRGWYYGLAGLVFIGAVHYLIACLTTAYYNNPNYQTNSVREAFWLMWAGPTILVAAVLWPNRAKFAGRWLIISAISWGVFIVGWVGPSVFNLVLPVLGLQWYALALPLAVWSYQMAESSR